MEIVEELCVCARLLPAVARAGLGRPQRKRQVLVEDLKNWLSQLDRLNPSQRQAQWEAQFKPLGPEKFLPAFLEAFPRLRKATSRVFVVFSSIRYAASHPEAFQLGLAALKDKATLVRYRGCMLLAVAQKAEALEPLVALVGHVDSATAADARAAIAAIQKKNHHLFVDRQATGRLFLEFA